MHEDHLGYLKLFLLEARSLHGEHFEVLKDFPTFDSVYYDCMFQLEPVIVVYTRIIVLLLRSLSEYLFHTRSADSRSLHRKLLPTSLEQFKNQLN